MTDVRVTEQDVQSLAQKLAEFTRTLSPGELAAFELLEEQMLMAFTSDEPDVQAFDFGRLDMLGGDARREELLRDATRARAPRETGDRAGFWRTVIGSVALTRRAEQRQSE